MKKLLAMILCLMMPVAAMAGTVSQENGEAVDFGDFLMVVTQGDELEMGEKKDNEVLLTLIPHESANPQYPAKISVVWTAGNEEYAGTQTQLQQAAEAFMENAAAEMQADGKIVANKHVISCEVEPTTGAMILYISLDCNLNREEEATITVYQMQISLNYGEGVYCFTFSGTNHDEVRSMLQDYFTTVQFK